MIDGLRGDAGVNTFTHLRQVSDTLSDLVERRARFFEMECAATGTPLCEGQVTVMWGGGKDSTLTLILACALSDLTGCCINAITMAHPGLSIDTLLNVRTIINELQVRHEWWQFRKPVSSPAEAESYWSLLYKVLAPATAFHPRFMCIGCNFGSIVTEYSALHHHKSHFLATGNSRAELSVFDEWTINLKKQFAGKIAFPDVTGKPSLDYYRLWWAVYHGLLGELAAVKSKVDFFLDESYYLFSLPCEGDIIGRVRSLPLLEDDQLSYNPAAHRDVLSSFGWRLPGDIQGGTESDCMMPAAIAELDIRRSGIKSYLVHLQTAVDALQPLPEMQDRAIEWVTAGRSSIEGKRLLSKFGVEAVSENGEMLVSPIALALVQELLPVR